MSHNITSLSSYAIENCLIVSPAKNFLRIHTKSFFRARNQGPGTARPILGRQNSRLRVAGLARHLPAASLGSSAVAFSRSAAAPVSAAECAR